MIPPSRRAPEQRDRWLVALLQHSRDLVLAFDAHGALRYENPAVERLLGPGNRRLEDRGAFDRVHPDDVASMVEVFARALESPGVPLKLACRVMRADGSYAYVEGLGTNLLEDPAVRSVVVNLRDVTHQRLTDPLTGLANRTMLASSLELGLSRRGSTFAFFAIRGVRIDQVLAGLSKAQTLELLGITVARLRAAAGPDDLVGRLDKRTFGLLARGTGGLDGALTVASRLRRTLGAPAELGGNALIIEGRVGVALGPEPGATPADYIANAEFALDSATTPGVTVFEPVLRERARSRLALEGDLRRALSTGELVPYYQPIVRVSTGAIEGFEALVRWRKLDGKLVPPPAFIGVAEQAGLIQELDLHVLRLACAFTQRLRETGREPFVHVNLSAAHFASDALSSAVQSALDATGLPGTALKLEVTETALMENAETAAGVMHALHARGVRFSLDDFGTGYSSLSYLHRFPFETLKIDRSFINALGVEQSRPELAEAIVLLARSLGLSVVAEGVETAAQLEFLRARHCDAAQGFLFSPAVPADEAHRLFVEQPFASQFSC